MIVSTLDHGRLVLKRFMGYPDSTWDTETQPKEEYADDKKSTLTIGRYQIRIWSLCHRGESYSFPTSLMGNYPTMFEWAELFKPLAVSKKKRKVFHNFNYDGNAFIPYGLTFPLVWDTVYGCHYANPNIERDLKSRANLYGRYIQKTKTIDFSDLIKLAAYAEDDVVATDELFQMHQYGKVVRPEFIHYINEHGKIVQRKNPMPELTASPENESLSSNDRKYITLQELPVLRAVIRAERMGFPLDRLQIGYIRRTIQKEQRIGLQQIYRMAGAQFSLGSAKKLIEVFTKLKITIIAKTKKGAPSVAAASLYFLQDAHPIVKKILKYRQNEKQLSTYVGAKGLVYYADKNHRIHTTLNSVGARTGRFSCVDGATEIETSRGTFPIAQYLPQEGDLVRTHTGEAKPILRKIYKGIDAMVRVVLANGSTIVCTRDHRVLSGHLWKRLAELTVGDTVRTYEYKSSTVPQYSGAPESDCALPLEREANSGASSLSASSESTVSTCHTEALLASGTVCSRESSPVLAQQDGSEKPYAGQEWHATSQLHRTDWRRSRVSDAQSGREVRTGTPEGISYGDRAHEAFEGFRDSPSRREQAQQPAVESGTGSFLCPQKVSYESSQIVEITSVGERDVWDIEVADNHSYLAHGFINHNSSTPNLQNIPASKDIFGIRKCFVAPKGQSIICLDFAQIEIRTMAILCKDPEMRRVLMDPDGDIHQNTADQFSVDRSPTAKQINFLLLYAGQSFALATKLTLEGAPTTPQMAQGYIDRYNEVYAEVAKYRKRLLQEHQRKGYVQYLLGRKRYLLDVDWSSKREQHKAETTLSNNINQGSAQDLLKASIVRCDPSCINPDKAVLNHFNFSKTHVNRLKDYGHRLEKVRRLQRLAHCRWALQVHDETLYFCDTSAAEDIGHMIAEVMTWMPYFEPITNIDIPLVVDGGVGCNWAHAKGKEPIVKLEHFGKVMH